GNASGYGRRTAAGWILRDVKVSGCRSDEHRDGVLILRALHAEIDKLGARTFELRLRLRDIALGCQAAFEAGVRKVERLLIRIERGAEQLRLKIESAQLEICDGEEPLQAEASVGEIGGGRLRVGGTGLDLPANAAPEVGLPGDVDGQQKVPVVTLGCCRERRAVRREIVVRR